MGDVETGAVMNLKVTIKIKYRIIKIFINILV